MRASNERSCSVDDAILAVRAEFDKKRLRVDLSTRGPACHDIVYCEVRDRDGTLQADSAGKGGGAQSVASALFEAWEHYWCCNGLDTLRYEVGQALPISDVLAQPELAAESMLRRLAADFPDAVVGCLPFHPIAGDGDPVWYPAFTKNPAFRRYLVPGDDHVYGAYDRYATGNGTAGGTSVDDALLHALLEVVERDALSFALLNWYGSPNPVALHVDPARLPADLAAQIDLTSSLFARRLEILKITTDIDIPVYCALPPYLLFPQANHFGAGASLSPAYAIERAVSELAQFVVVNASDEHVAVHRRRMDYLAEWPLIARCTEQDPATPLRAAVPADDPGEGWEGRGGSVAEQLAEALRRLEARGMRGYWLRWDPGTTVPVVCVLVPGLETFFLARQGVPVVPSGRAAAHLSVRL